MTWVTSHLPSFLEAVTSVILTIIVVIGLSLAALLVFVSVAGMIAGPFKELLSEALRQGAGLRIEPRVISAERGLLPVERRVVPAAVAVVLVEPLALLAEFAVVLVGARVVPAERAVLIAEPEACRQRSRF